jgi:hypothetical protein
LKLTVLSSYGRSGDFLFDSTGLTIWTTAELNVGILAGSIPCLKPLFKVILEKSGHASHNGNTKSKPGNGGYVMQSSQDTTKSRGGSNGSRSGIGGGEKNIER